MTYYTAETFGKWFINAPNYVSAYYMPVNLDPKSKYVSISATCFGNETLCANAFDGLKTNCYSDGDAKCEG